MRRLRIRRGSCAQYPTNGRHAASYATLLEGNAVRMPNNRQLAILIKLAVATAFVLS